MPIQSQQPGHHRVLLRADGELPDGYESRFYTDGQGVTRHSAVYPDEEGDPTYANIALDFPAARFSPADSMRMALESWGGRNPAGFLPAPALVAKRADPFAALKSADGEPLGALGGAFAVEKTDDGRMFVSGPVYRAGKLDTDDEFMRQVELKNFAHSLLVEGSRKGDTDHDRNDRVGLLLVESTMVREEAGKFVVDGGGDVWFAKYEVVDPIVKARVEMDADEAGSLNAFSWDGLVRKRPAVVSKSAAEAPTARFCDIDWKGLDGPGLEAAFKSLDPAEKDEGAEATELFDGRCIRVSLVHRGANGEFFAVAQKSADADQLLSPPAQTAPTSEGWLGRMKAWIAGGDSAENPLDGLDSFVDTVQRFRSGVEVALASQDPEPEIKALARALGDVASREALSALKSSTPARGSWFAGTASQENSMTPEQLQEIVTKQVKAALAAEDASGGTDDNGGEGDSVTVEDVTAAAKAAATEAAAQAEKAADEKYAAQLAEKEEALKQAAVDLARAKSAPAATPSGGSPGASGEAASTDPWASLKSRQDQRRAAKSQHYANPPKDAPFLQG